ncbi:MAG: glycerol-3-phosphate dehydrogenase C-terminal domain-containing protein, partial [Phycisphaerales bacterium]|nr:glycerol-3-phosphate dehydrogenase C-terminal domain-containing protein [Phycisphaerales bacterium]
KENWLRVYGADAGEVMGICDELERGHEFLHDRLPYPRGVVVHAARLEQARTVEDVLARRTRALLLDARAAGESARSVADLLAKELGRDAEWVDSEVEGFLGLVEGYVGDE